MGLQYLEEKRANVGSGGSSTSDLLAAFRSYQQGKLCQFDDLYEALWLPVYARARKLGLGPEESQDTAQKVMVRVYLYAKKVSFVSVEKLWAWVYTITTREIYKCWRKRRPQAVPADVMEVLVNRTVDLNEGPAEATETAEAVSDVGECIGQLAEIGRLYLLGPLVQNLTFREAAALHGLSLGKFKHRYEKALRQVRDCMKAKGHVLD